MAYLTDEELAAQLGKPKTADVKALFSQPDKQGMTHAYTATAQSAEAPSFEDPGMLRSVVIGLGRSGDKIGAGIKQASMALADRLPRQVTGMVSPGDFSEARQRLADEQQQNDELYAPLKAARPWATGIGEGLTSVPARAVGFWPTVAASAVGAAVPEAMKYGDAGDRAKNAALGAAGVAAGSAVGQAIGGAIPRILNMQPIVPNLSPEAAKAVGVLQQAGIPLSLGEQTGSKVLRGLEDAALNIPATATRAAADKLAKQQAFNRAVADLAGYKDPTLTAITPEIADVARSAAGKQIGAVAERNTLTASPQFVGDLIKLQEEVGKFAADGVAKPVLARINQTLSRLETDQAGGAVMTGRAFRELQSDIGKQMQGASGDLKGYLGTLRDTLRAGMNESIPAADKQAWEAANQTYRNALALKQVAQNSPSGDITPRGLFNATKKNGTAEMRDLGASAAQIISDLANSGTAQRSLYQEMLQNPISAAYKAALTPPLMVTQGLLGLAGKRPQGLLNIPPQLMRVPAQLGGYGGGLLGMNAMDVAAGYR